jgi:hypothetical protein
LPKISKRIIFEEPRKVFGAKKGKKKSILFENPETFWQKFIKDVQIIIVLNGPLTEAIRGIGKNTIYRLVRQLSYELTTIAKENPIYQLTKI